MDQPRFDPEAYTKAVDFLHLLKKHHKMLTFQQWHTLRGQALSGDLAGAHKGLEILVRRYQRGDDG